MSDFDNSGPWYDPEDDDSEEFEPADGDNNWESFFDMLYGMQGKLSDKLKDAAMMEAAKQAYGPSITYIYSSKTLIYHFLILPMQLPEPTTGLVEREWQAIPLEQNYAIPFQEAMTSPQVPDWDTDCWLFSYKELFGRVQDEVNAEHFPVTTLHFHLTWNEALTPRSTFEDEVVQRLTSLTDRQESEPDAFADFLSDLLKKEDDTDDESD